MKYKIGQKITIKWLDHCSIDEWQSIADCKPEDALCTSTGYVVYQDAKIISLASTLSADKKHCACTMNILKKLIVK